MRERRHRRLAAIVAADIAGYSKLIGADEEGTLAALSAIRSEVVDPLLAEHGGRIANTAGDSLLLEFASVVDAVRCAVASQRAMAERNADIPGHQRIEFRIGVNLGDIVAEGDDIHGDGVNVAARLEGFAEPGGIALSAAAYDQVRGRVEADFEDAGLQHFKNIDRPVQVWRWTATTSTIPGIVDVSEPIPGFGGRPAIAVLAFDNLSQDPEQEFLADGIAEDILTRLAMWRWMPVIARNSSFTYKGRAIDAKSIGLELGARYILEGSVRRAGKRVRVTGQLIDTETDHHVWADRYDRDLDDLFAVQDEITDAIVAALEPAIGRAEMQRAQRKAPQSLDAWDYHQRGMWHLNKVTEGDLELANEMFQRSANTDPSFAPPHAGIGLLGFLLRTLGYDVSWAPSREEIVAVGRRAARLDDLDPFAHAGHGFSAMVGEDMTTAVAAARRSIELNPSFALGYHCLHSATFFLGDFRTSIDAVRQACRISPNDPWLFYYLTGISACHYMMREYDQAVEVGRKAVERYADYANAQRWLALSLAQSGRVDEATEVIERWHGLVGNAAEKAHSAYPLRDAQHLEHYRDGLRKVGL